MTVEATRTESKSLGLRKTTRTRVLEFRAYHERVSETITLIGRPDSIMLKGSRAVKQYKEIHEIEFVFAEPISEDEVEVRRSIGLGYSDLEKSETVIFSREQINEANLVSETGERISWRPTKVGDYPPLKPGQEARPIQQSLKFEFDSPDFSGFDVPTT